MRGIPCADCPIGSARCGGSFHPELCEGIRGHARRFAGPLAEGRSPPSRPPSDLDLRVAMLAETCPNGSGECGCGGKPRTCSRNGRPDAVFRAFCITCKTVDWWQEGVEAGW